jgi:hypothetical protein
MKMGQLDHAMFCVIKPKGERAAASSHPKMLSFNASQSLLLHFFRLSSCPNQDFLFLLDLKVYFSR